MATFRITDPNTGRTIRITGDSAPTEQELEQIFAQASQPAEQPEASQAPPISPEIMALGQNNQDRGFVEGATTLATGAIAEPIAGALGAVQAINPFAEPGAGAETVESVREALTFQPRTQEGQQVLQGIGETIAPVVEPISRAIKAASDFAFDITGSPAVAAAVQTTPAAIAEFVGLGGLRRLRSGTRLIDDAGRPTKALQRVLDDQGLVYDNLTPEAKNAIPEFATPRALPSPKSEVGRAAEQALIEQIRSGGRGDALAGLKVVGNRLEADKLGQEAIKQGFDPGFVQTVKTANPETKAAMGRMLDMMQRITKERGLSSSFRPTDVVGEAVLDRVKFIRNQANDARIRLDQIAERELSGVPIDPQPIVDRLGSALDDLKVRLETGTNGIPKPIYQGSQISKDRTSQRIINDLIDLMSEGGAPDASRFHNLKRQLDTMIDFRKKSSGGLTDAGRNVLKDIRTSLNESIRAVNPQYAEVNDILSQSLQSLDDFNKATGTIDIFAEGADKAIGTNLRGLLSNIQGRIRLDNSLNQLDEVASNLGGNFKTDYRDLTQFANGLEDRFGAVAQSSFKGEIESALRTGQQAVSQGPRAAATEAVFGAARGAAERLRGINEFNAFQSMKDLLNR